MVFFEECRLLQPILWNVNEESYEVSFLEDVKIDSVKMMGKKLTMVSHKILKELKVTQKKLRIRQC